MTKHRWHKSLKSFIGSHIDSKKDEELKKSKAVAESNIQKISELLKTNGEDGKEPLAELIDSLYSQYESLYASYDHLTGELREKVNGKQGKESYSSSSSSDSDSDHTPRKKDEQNGNTENKKIKEQLETANWEVADLRRKLAIALEDKEALNLKYQGSLHDAQQELESLKKDLSSKTTDHQRMMDEKESMLRNVNNEFEEQIRNKIQELVESREEKERIQGKISEMDKALMERESELSILKQKTQDREIEGAVQITALTEQVSNLQGKLDSVCSEKIQLDSLLEKRNGEISEYLAQIENLKEEIASKTADGNRMLEEIESLRMQVKDLDAEVESFRKKKGEWEEEIGKKNEEINQLMEEKEGLHIKFSGSEKSLMEKGDELSALHEKLEDLERETSAEIVVLNEQIEKFRQNVESLLAEKDQLKVQIDRHNQESSEQAENHKAELANRIMEYESRIKEQEYAFNKLSEDHKRLEVGFEECKGNLNVAEKKLEGMSVKFQKDIDAKNQKIDELEETIEDLRRDLETKADEVTTLVGYVSTIEVKLRLSNQKLRVTEQLLAEKDDEYKKKEEKLLEEKKSLEERIGTLTEIVATYKAAQHRIVTDISKKVSDTMNGIDSLNVKFEEDYGHLESRIYEILNELKLASNWIKEATCKKQLLEEEVAKLVQQLKIEKEQEVTLRDKIEELELTLSKAKDERKGLMQSIEQLEGKAGQLQKLVQEKDTMIVNLETSMKEKDSGISELGEEKREAIRQLCIGMDYHRGRYDSLREMVSKMTGRRRQITA